MTPEQIEHTLAGILTAISGLQKTIEADRQAHAESLEAERQVRERDRQIYQAQMAELREGQALLVQMFVEQREEFKEFKHTVNATLDRMDRFMNQVDQRLNNLESKT